MSFPSITTKMKLKQYLHRHIENTEGIPKSGLYIFLQNTNAPHTASFL